MVDDHPPQQSPTHNAAPRSTAPSSTAPSNAAPHSAPPAVPTAATSDDQRSAVARAVFPGGDEPDPRFTLANERTFLAWTRTALAFMAGGIGLEAIPVAGIPSPMRTVVSVFVIAVGVLVALGAAVRWVRVERAMRAKKPLPVPLIVPLIALASVVACLVVLAVDIL